MHFLPPDDYQPQAEQLFQKISQDIHSVLPQARIEHIGSSAIPQAFSKGDLDIYVGVSAERFNQAINAIKSLGFSIKPDTLLTEELCPFESNAYPLEVGIQLITLGSKFEFFLTFRDRLKEVPDLVRQYNQIKLKCRGMEPRAYRKIKSQFIESVLQQINEGINSGSESDPGY